MPRHNDIKLITTNIDDSGVMILVVVCTDNSIWQKMGPKGYWNRCKDVPGVDAPPFPPSPKPTCEPK